MHGCIQGMGDPNALEMLRGLYSQNTRVICVSITMRLLPEVEPSCTVYLFQGFSPQQSKRTCCELAFAASA